MAELLVVNDVEMVLAEVRAERLRQHEKWGIQDHAPEVWLMILGEEVGEATRQALETWAMVKGGFSPRAAAELRLGEYRQELVQVAAVAVAMVESVDRNELRREVDGG